MSNTLLHKIEIENFKCFNNFKVDGFKRVNLIGGKNNIGKTALLEACYTNIHAHDIGSFIYSLANINRQCKMLNETIVNKELIELRNGDLIRSNLNNSFYKIEENNGIKKIYL